MTRNMLLIVILTMSGLQAVGPDYEKVINTFVGFSKAYAVSNFIENVDRIEIPNKNINSAPYNFFGIHENNQTKVNFPELKKKLISLMKIDHKNAIQIIGDSGKFSKAGTKKGRIFLRNEMDKANLVEYGFTGYKNLDGKELDINSFVNEYIDEGFAAQKVLANILGHTPVAIKKWGTYGSPKVLNYVVVYNDYNMSQEPQYVDGKKVGGFTTFGNDIIMSDYLLQASDYDKFICLEGGVQSFLQIINALTKGIPVTMVYNLRTPERDKFFSATRYLKNIADDYKQNNELTQKEVQNIFDIYAKTLNNIWDPNKPDHQTKKELFTEGINRFVKNELYKKVPSLCAFIDSNMLPG